MYYIVETFDVFYLFCTYPKIFYEEFLRKSFLTTIFYTRYNQIFTKNAFFFVDKLVLEKVLLAANYVRNEN